MTVELTPEQLDAAQKFLGDNNCFYCEYILDIHNKKASLYYFIPETKKADHAFIQHLCDKHIDAYLKKYSHVKKIQKLSEKDVFYLEITKQKC